MKTIYSIKLHETIIIDNNLKVMRVPNGWNYMYDDKQPFFVEYNSEYLFKKAQLNLDPEVVIRSVREYYNLRKGFIDSKSRFGDIPLAKKVIVKILMEFGNSDYKRITKLLKYKNVSTIPYAIRTLDYYISNDKFVRNQYKEILKSLQLK